MVWYNNTMSEVHLNYAVHLPLDSASYADFKDVTTTLSRAAHTDDFMPRPHTEAAVSLLNEREFVLMHSNLEADTLMKSPAFSRVWPNVFSKAIRASGPQPAEHEVSLGEVKVFGSGNKKTLGIEVHDDWLESARGNLAELLDILAGVKPLPSTLHLSLGLLGTDEKYHQGLINKAQVLIPESFLLSQVRYTPIAVQVPRKPAYRSA